MKWLKIKSEEDYITYCKIRRETKRIVKIAKDESWKNYGEHLTHQTPRQF